MLTPSEAFSIRCSSGAYVIVRSRPVATSLVRGMKQHWRLSDSLGLPEIYRCVISSFSILWSNFWRTRDRGTSSNQRIWAREGLGQRFVTVATRAYPATLLLNLFLAPQEARNSQGELISLLWFQSVLPVKVLPSKLSKIWALPNLLQNIYCRLTLTFEANKKKKN